MSINSISHALEDYLNNRQSADRSSAGVIVEVETNYNFLIIRGSSKDNEFLMHAEELFGQSLPLDFNVFNVGEHTMYWMSPNEWLVSSKSDIKRFIKTIRSKVNMHAIDQTGGLVQMTLQGERVRDLLAKGCTLNVDEGVLLPGQCAQTGLSKANILLSLINDSPKFNLIVRRSYAEYVARWLEHAGDEFGLDLII
ncbi:MAG: sarcosine oxidase subunit gamma family protein [Pseudomonadota bacterium]|nr:sarcosine oxidase subunit gamma family protein [Pseudomonadota bacterium]